MKITHITGETVDTDALPDTEAMVIEKVEEFRQFCFENSIPFLMFIDRKGLEDGYTSFWNHKSRNTDVAKHSEDQKINIGPILFAIDDYVRMVSNQDLYIASRIKK